MALDVSLAGLLKTMKTTFRLGEHIPHHISQAPEDEVTLLTNAAVTGAWMDWPGGLGLWEAWGVFDGATVQLQKSPDGGTEEIDVDDAGLSVKGGFIFTLPADKIRVKFIVAGGGSCSISSKAKQC
jgi:hypothetical protein